MDFSTKLLATAALFTTVLSGQSPSTTARPDSTPQIVFRAETGLALVSFHVMRDGKYLDDLRAEDIQVEQDGIAQRIAIFEGGAQSRKVPVEITFLFDCSGSMKHDDVLKPLSFKASLLDRFKHVSIALYAFNWPRTGNEVAQFTPPTRDVKALRTAMDRIRTYGGGNTRLYGSILVTLETVSKGNDNVSRMLVVVSDGLSNSFMRTESIQSARNHGIPIYPVLRKLNAVDLQPFLPGVIKQSPEEVAARLTSTFTSLAAETGGLVFPPSVNEKDLLPGILTTLADLVRTEYIVGFYPDISGTKKPHQLRVVLRDKDRGSIQAGSRKATY